VDAAVAERLRSGAHDAVVVGSGPNGLAAAVTLARAGRSVLVVEAADSIGGGTRTAALTLPGFQHDVCSAIHPLARDSPFFKTLPLADHGLRFVDPPAPLAHPLDDGSAVLLHRSLRATAADLGEDSGRYAQVFGPVVGDWPRLAPDLLGPFPIPPRHPLALARFGLRALWPARALARLAFRGVRARALFAGLAAHSILPLEWSATAAFGLVLGALAHAVGWPLAEGGSQRIADALASYLRSLGGEVLTGVPVESVAELPEAAAVLLDVTPRQLLRLSGERLPARYRRRLARYRYGPGVFKLDLALDAPIPWRARACAQAATVHLGGTLEEIAASESAVWRGEHPAQPFVLLAQPSLFDARRAPAGKHTVWAYCHVPHGSTLDRTDAILAQIERFAPGFRARVLAARSRGPADLERGNANMIGGDINGGAQHLAQMFTRPLASLDPYATPLPNVSLCSSSTPPGGGVHGMCGYHAARSALRRVLR
jgi:phytoene dehydrogenase-like protein